MKDEEESPNRRILRFRRDAQTFLSVAESVRKSYRPWKVKAWEQNDAPSTSLVLSQMANTVNWLALTHGPYSPPAE